jgi:hypothetical protein
VQQDGIFGSDRFEFSDLIICVFCVVIVAVMKFKLLWAIVSVFSDASILPCKRGMNILAV